MLIRRMKEAYEVRFSRRCYYICLGIIAAAIISLIILHVLGIAPTEIIDSPCVWITCLGIYCPGCGGTRAVEALCKGQLWKSFVYHPLVLYTAVLIGVYVISHTLNIVTKGRIRAMMFRPVYLYLMIVIIVIQCIVKNVLKFSFGIVLC